MELDILDLSECNARVNFILFILQIWSKMDNKWKLYIGDKQIR